MSVEKWERKVLRSPGASRRAAEIERELRLAAGLAVLREDAGFTQRELAKRIGVSQPRIAAIEQSKNVTIDVLQQYVASVGAQLEITAVKGTKRIPLLTSEKRRRSIKPRPSARPKSATAKKRPRAR